MTRKHKMVPVTLGGEEHSLLYDFNALCALEEESNSDLQTILQNAGRMTNLRLLLWAGLIHENAGLTPVQVGEWIETDQILDLVQKLQEAMARATPKDERATTTKKN